MPISYKATTTGPLKCKRCDRDNEEMLYRILPTDAEAKPVEICINCFVRAAKSRKMDRLIGIIEWQG